VEVASEQVETLGGYIQEQRDHLPQVGNTISLGSYLLRVEAMDGRRVARVRVTPHTIGETARAVEEFEIK
jgi:CBS domain containing-hemolysin-like protein